MNTWLGQQISNYRLTRSLGNGGFADVYLGEHIQLNMQVAIKVLRSGLGEEHIQQFYNEAQTLVDLEHPHIVRVKEFGIVEGRIPFIVMDYAPNGSLRQQYPKGSRVPLDTIVFYVKQVADALQYAHDRKKIHRDIKPENMLMSANGQILLSDFGLADVAKTSMTGTQIIKDGTSRRIAGTPEYMSPEQFRGKLRRATDQYALGVVIYEWLSGKLPFIGTIYALEYQHIHKSPPPFHTINVNAPSAVEEVVMKALAKKPQERFENIQLFAEAFEKAYQRSLSGGQLVSPWSSPHESLISTVVKEPLMPPQRSRQPTKDESPAQPSSVLKAQPSNQLSQSGDESSGSIQRLRSSAMAAPSSKTSRNAAQVNTIAAVSSRETEEIWQEAHWMNLRWFILVSAFLSFFVFPIGIILQLSFIIAIGLISLAIYLVLGLLQTGHYNQWHWFTAFLILGPLTGILYGIVDPKTKPNPPINLKQLIIVLASLGYAFFAVAFVINAWPLTSSMILIGSLYYISAGFVVSSSLLGFIRTFRAIGGGEWIMAFVFFFPFAGLISVFSKDLQPH